MLVECHECLNDVSEYAQDCPHCGFPIGQYKNIERTEDEYIENCLYRLYKLINKHVKFKPSVTFKDFLNGEKLYVNINNTSSHQIYLNVKYITRDDIIDEAMYSVGDYDWNDEPPTRLSVYFSFKDYDEIFNIDDFNIDFDDRFEPTLPYYLDELQELIISCLKLSASSYAFFKEFLAISERYDENECLASFHDGFCLAVKEKLKESLIKEYFEKIGYKIHTYYKVISNNNSGLTFDNFQIGTHCEGEIYNKQVFKDVHRISEDLMIINRITLELEEMICEYNEHHKEIMYKVKEEEMNFLSNDSRIYNEFFKRDKYLISIIDERMTNIISFSKTLKHKVFCPTTGRELINLHTFLKEHVTNEGNVLSDERIELELEGLNEFHMHYLNLKFNIDREN